MADTGMDIFCRGSTYWNGRQFFGDYGISHQLVADSGQNSVFCSVLLYAEGRRTDKNSVFISSDFCCLTDPVDPYTGEKNGKKHIFVRKTIVKRILF